MPKAARAGERVLRGLPVSPGVCRGRLLVLCPPQDTVVPRLQLEPEELPGQIQRFEHALVETRRQIHEIQRHVSETLGVKDASIFEAHMLVLEDPILLDEISRLVLEQRINVEYAVQQFVEKFIASLSSSEDQYLRERAADLRDVAARLLNNLLGRTHEADLRHLAEHAIIISHDLTPSRTALLDREKVLGFGTDVGSRTSHTAIMAKSMRIPAVVGLQNASHELVTGEYALLDGYNGLIIVNPTDQTLFEYGQLVRKHITLEEKLRETRDLPAVTLDGVSVGLLANVEQPADTEAVFASGADGVGLFRTEFMFINRVALPSEEEQYQAYRQVAAALNPRTVVIRTLDLGGDKFLSQLAVPTEMNPFLGWRAIRFCLEHRELFRNQLRAILRASAEGNVKMMYPMISGLEELNRANAYVEEYKQELRNQQVPFDEHIEIGAMIEIPSAAIAADALAKRVKFFSIGTNDLIQYTLAVDRLNEKIAHLYEPTHPAIVRLIKTTADAAHRAGIPVAVCGEMASDPSLVPLLLGLGVNELSIAPPHVPQVKYLIRRLKLSVARELADSVLECDSGEEIRARFEAYARQVAPALFEPVPELA
ncbi:MAG: phosphoenolpyruvate--protein phosphotransferase [Verrucomicrobia bacterium]|nr:phosphoenolpyruvate--protein phosphotransferase [Verrucomicrobiota bacterium]